MYVSAHQPYLLGWLPYWNKILKSDLHLMLLGVDFTKRDDYVHRTTLLGQTYTVAVPRQCEGKPIGTVVAVDGELARFKKSLTMLYGKKFAYRDRLDLVLDALPCDERSWEIALSSIRMIVAMLKFLGWKGEAQIVAGGTEGDTKSDRVANRLTAALSSLTLPPEQVVYLCGDGTSKFLDQKFPYPFCMQSVAKPQPSILDVLLSDADPLDRIQSSAEWIGG